MNFRNISAWAIRNPVPPIVLFCALTLAGLVSFMRMPLNQNPEITFPGVYVQITQPGAAPTEMETQITQRVEAAVRNLEGVEEIDSTVTEAVQARSSSSRSRRRSTALPPTCVTPSRRSAAICRRALSSRRSSA